MSPVNRSALRKGDVREANQRLLLNIIRQKQGTSRADLVRITGFSASSVSFIINRMIRDGLIAETRCEDHAQVGRRPLILHIQPESLIAAAVEIGRSGARLALADLNGAILKQRSVHWHADPEVFLTRVRHAVLALTSPIDEGRLLGIGVGISGTTDRTTGRVTAAENLGWFDVNAGAILSAGIPIPFYFENDSILRALAERWFADAGAQTLENFVFLAAAPGLGAGVVIEGRLFHGATGEASEFGHTILYPDGRPCVCGGFGCWEEYASQRAFERLYSERAGTAGQEGRLNAEAIVRLARHGNAVALEVLQTTATYAGLGIANLIAAYDPEAIILGDYLASAWDLMKDRVWEILRKQAPHRNLRRLRIQPSRQGKDSGLKGALALVLSRFLAEPGSVASSMGTGWNGLTPGSDAANGETSSTGTTGTSPTGASPTGAGGASGVAGSATTRTAGGRRSA